MIDSSHKLGPNTMKIPFVKTTIITFALVTFALATGIGASAVWATDAPATLAAEAKLTLETAASHARARVPGGSIVSAELEREHGTLVWSFDIATPMSKNITEVQIDAKTGKLIAEKTETPKDQAKEVHASSAH